MKGHRVEAGNPGGVVVVEVVVENVAQGRDCLCSGADRREGMILNIT